MNFSLGHRRILGLFATSIALLVACQSTNPDPAPTTQTVIVPLTVGAVSRIPDSLAWRVGSIKGSKKVVCPTVICHQEFELKSPMGANDTFFIDLWKLGVTAGTAKFISVNGSSTLKALPSSANSPVVNLLESFATFRASKDSLKNPTTSDLVAYYARLLLDSAAIYTGKELPTGMSAPAVKQAVVLLSSQRGLTNYQLQSKGILALTADSIRVYVAILVKAKLIADTTVLFPVSPLWIQSELSVGDLTQGESPVAVHGVFAWKTPRNVSAVIEVRNAQGREDSISKKFQNLLISKDGSWSLTDNLTLQANMGAKPGTDTLVATLSDDSGHSVSARTTFKVLRGDTLKPTIKVLNPPSDTTVDNATSSFVVRIEATDNKAVVGVKIGTKSFTEAPYIDTVDLSVGGNVIAVEAWDASGNRFTKNVVIIRSKPTSGGDTTNPDVKLLAPTSDLDVPFATSTFELSWKATDNVGLTKVTLDDQTITSSTDTYKKTVTLVVGPNLFVLKAFDAAGNTDTLSFRIMRAPDPAFVGIVPLADRSVLAEQDTAILNWTLTNVQKATAAHLDGSALTISGSSAGKSVSLSSGANTFILTVKDSSGKTISDTVVITRAADAKFVGIVPLADRSVLAEQDTAILNWTLTNVQKATAAHLDGSALTISGNSVGKTVSVSSGPNTFILTVKDSSGKTISDTVVITRAADAKGPSIAWITPTKSATVEATVTSYPVRVKVTDPSGVDSVYLFGAKAKIDSGDIWIATLDLPRADGTPIIVRAQAWDKKKNVTLDTSVSITRSVPDGTDKPAIALVQPTAVTGNTLPFDSAMLHVQAKITDLVPVDPATVFFNNVAAKKEGDLYSADVPVPATGTAFTITIKAANTSKNGSTLDLTVTRAKDPVDPVITPSADTKSQTVPFDTKTFDLSWTISDNDSLATLKFNGSVEPTSGTLKKTVNLAVGTDTFTLVATDRAGNSSTSRIVLTRSPDLVAPVLDILSPSQDTTLPYGATTIAVQTKATDAGSGIKSVAINGILADKSGLATVSLTANKVNLVTAIATDSAGNTDTATVNVTVKDIVATPTFSPIASTYTTAQTVTIASATSGAAIYYTTDGSAPTTASLSYSTPLTVSATQTIKAIAVKTGMSNSVVGTADFVIKPLAGTPTFSPLPSITYLAAQSVTITSTTAGASIYYTTDGSTPTTSSTLYTGPLTLSTSDTLRAIAVKPGLTNSIVGNAIYSIFDVTLKTVVLNGTMNVPVTGANLRSDSLAAFSDVAISTTPTDPSASVTLSLASPIKMITDPIGVLITVKKGTESKVYTLALIPRQAGTFKDTRDNYSYKAIKIGSQWWMAQNLNYAGPLDTLGTCYRDTCDKYGRGYLALADVLAGATASTTNPSGIQGICPSGWHLPSYDEWVSLALVAGGGTDTAAGIKKLKSRAETYPWTYMTKGPGPTAVAVYTDHSGTDDLGFTMQPLQGWGAGSSSGSQSLNFAVFYTSSGYVRFFDDASPTATTSSPRMSVRCKLD